MIRRKRTDRSTRARRLPRLALTLIATVASTVTPSSPVGAQVRIPFPTPQDPGGPVYTTIERGIDLHDGPVAAVLFYRDPSCVPADFNLLDGQDLSGFPDNPRAFACASTVDGFGVWRQAPPADVVPRHVLTRGTGAVPVWFVAWSELETAMADGSLTIGELRTLPSLQVSYAIHFEEHRVLSAISDPSDFAPTEALEGTAHGAWDGITGLRTFEFSYSFERGSVRRVRIQRK